MPSTYSSKLRFELIGSGEQSGTWGTTTNTNIGTLIEQAIAGVSAVVMTDANYTLVASNGSSDEARNPVLQVTGTLTAARDVICPTASKVYLVYNNTTGGFAITIKTAAGSGISVASGKKMFVYCDGTSVVDAMNNLPAGTQVGGSDIVTLTASQTLTSKSLTSPTLTSPTITGTLTCADNVFQIQDNADATKKLALELSGITTGNTRTLTVPDASTTIVGTGVTQTLTNKTLDNTSTSRRCRCYQASGLPGLWHHDSDNSHAHAAQRHNNARGHGLRADAHEQDARQHHHAYDQGHVVHGPR
jgi:hypothetical protein